MRSEQEEQSWIVQNQADGSRVGKDGGDTGLPVPLHPVS